MSSGWAGRGGGKGGTVPPVLEAKLGVRALPGQQACTGSPHSPADLRDSGGRNGQTWQAGDWS